MASSSSARFNIELERENENTNAYKEIVISPSVSATPSVGTLFSSCFNWCSFFLSQFSTGRHSNAFQGIAPSPSATDAFEQVAPSTSARSTMAERKLPYDVFINHRGPDVKRTLAATLYKTLTSMGLRVFLDKEELELGDLLPTQIEEAIRSASLHIAIFSQNYAQSPWCLAELSFMLKTGTPIVPVFYHVEADVVRYAKGFYAEAFSRHTEKGRYALEKLEEWKNALYNVSYNTGGILHNEEGEESVLKNIVNRVLKEIKKVPLVVAKHPVGLDEVVKDFERRTLQSPESHLTVQIVGIWGMGGSGKTTLAKQLYNDRYTFMDRSSFLLDIRDAAFRNKLHKKQRKLLEDLGLRGVSIDNVEEGKGILASRLRSIRVLIILDDVDDVEQLDALVPEKDNLGWGSLIVVTSRELDVLRCWGISSIYKMNALDPFHAKQLFCWHAFLQPSPRQAFEDLVEKFLNVCHGLPLSLKIFGAQLYGISDKDYWEVQLNKISRILPKDIKERLKVSYDALDDEEKQIFLDTACFFIGEERTIAIAAWDGSGWNGQHSWERLFNKCLVELNDDVSNDNAFFDRFFCNRIRMHDHLRDLGREIANNQSPYRLWSPQQRINVDNRVQGIVLRGIMATLPELISDFESISQFEQFGRCSQGGELIVNTSIGSCRLAPSSLGLKLLQVIGNYNNQVIGDLSRELVWLRWFGIEQRNPLSLCSLKNLRVLELHGKWDVEHPLEELWDTDSDAPVQLRVLLISRCPGFRRFPKSIGCLRHLKEIIVDETSKVRSLPKEFCLLQSLEHLNLSGCPELSSLPSSFGDLENLRHLDLSYCAKLRRLPVSFKKLRLLQHLDLDTCSELVLESDILKNMTKLEYLDLSHLRQLEELPLHITNQASLRELYLRNPGTFKLLPVNIGQLSKLRKMQMMVGLLTSLPTSIGDLSSLTSLQIYRCLKLECLPDSVGRLNSLEHLEIWSSGVKSLPKSIRQLMNLRTLIIKQCAICELNLGAELGNLKRIELSYNDHLTEIEVHPTRVEDIELKECEILRSIRGIDGLVNIQILKIIGCPKLDALPSFAHLASLREFELKGCHGVKKIHGMEHCRALETLRADTRWEEVGIETFERMERLRNVDLRAISRSGVDGCIQSMQKWPKKEIIVCTRALPDAVTRLNSFAFPSLSVIDYSANQKIKLSSKDRCNLLCFVVNCDCPEPNLSYLVLGPRGMIFSQTDLEKGKWVWIGLFTKHSRLHTVEQEIFQVNEDGFQDYLEAKHWTGEIKFDSKGKVEKRLLVTGEEERVVEAFRQLFVLLSN